MRAWQVRRAGEPDRALDRAEVEPPRPAAGQLRIRVRAAALGLPDLLMCRGSYPLTPALPFTPGQEAVGEVVEAGEGARVPVGARVMAVAAFHFRYGSLAEECLALDDFALAVPEGMSNAEAAGFVIPFHTAWLGLLRRGALRSGETLVVLGAAGGTGSAALQLGKSIGARVIAVARGADKIEFCRSLGADATVDYRAGDLAAGLREATGGRGADVVYDPVGGEAFEAASRCMAPEGRMLLIGFASGRFGAPSPARMVTGNYSVVGVLPSFESRAAREAAHEDLLARWRRREIRVPVHRVYAFEDVPLALADLAAGHVRGKAVIAAP
ncbi:MAG: NADPH:quinone oxidoreductase family protein [Deltaproteobacteria bacterium]|nr:NADPH:quinone oxidoreductase family protein [Deltaproteobacteria bacterium]